MPDQSEVENALVSLVAEALYPAGTDASSVPGPDCQIYRGWPTSSSLDDALAAGRINVTVFPMPEPGRNTTRYAPSWHSTSPAAGLTISVAAGLVTIGGNARGGQLVGIAVDRRSYVYRTARNDTIETIAAKLAALVRVDRIVTLSGAALQIPGAGHITARTVSDRQASVEVRRQEQGFRISSWCPTPTSRDLCASAIDTSLANIPFFAFSDGSQGRLKYRGTLVFDQSQDAMLYRRDLIYDVEYATVVTDQNPAMLFGNLLLNAADFIA